ncbi:MAG: 2-isopropylmalate synthase [Acidobacteria bacterium]|nr:2-isopropylmalate synthase [Acidobacteriota bacterium]
MLRIKETGLIYDWNEAGEGSPPRRDIRFDDETLRDGLQSPSVRDPRIEEKIELLHLMESLAIDTADIGLPGAGPRAVEDVTRLAQEIVGSRLRIRPNCAARTVVTDIQPIVDISQKVGIPVEACTFIGSSPIRQYAEDWTLDEMLKCSEEAVTFAVRHGLPVMFVTEDTTRANPGVLKKLYAAAIDWGARAICASDTVGHATPDGARNLIRFLKKEVVGPSRETVRLDWHGHNDRGLAVANTIAALEAGADQVHGCALALGERVGNTPMDQLLVNLQLMGYVDRDLSRLNDYCQAASRACAVSIPPNYPVMGRDAFRTATGVHAAAVIKAIRKGDVELANMVYSGVPSHWFGQEQIIEIGYMSGRSNIVYWLEKHGIPADAALVERIFQAAKQSTRLLTDQEISALVGRAIPVVK